jgi:Skp family chaperone for outer membrane proteins
MTRNYVLPAIFLIAVISVSAIAQRPANPSPAGPKPTPAATAQATPTPGAPAAATQLPTSKMAVIYTDLFLDPKSGITKFNSILAKLNGEFQKIKDELTQTQQRAQTLQDEITKLQQAGPGVPVDQRALQAKVDQLEQLKKDIQRKGEDAQAAYNRRRQELFAPLQEEIGKALEAFAKARGINAIIDATQVPLLYAAESIDITRAFITEFNSKNPATAVTPPPE